jgi:hypothetical protein
MVVAAAWRANCTVLVLLTAAFLGLITGGWPSSAAAWWPARY